MVNIHLVSIKTSIEKRWIFLCYLGKEQLFQRQCLSTSENNTYIHLYNIYTYMLICILFQCLLVILLPPLANYAN